jgi:hypothetical protein
MTRKNPSKKQKSKLTDEELENSSLILKVTDDILVFLEGKAVRNYIVVRKYASRPWYFPSLLMCLESVIDEMIANKVTDEKIKGINKIIDSIKQEAEKTRERFATIE